MSVTYPERVNFEDFALGDRFRFGVYPLSADEIVAFARQFDPEPFHLDDATARALGWGGLIASGLHMASILRRISKDAFPNVQTVISPGWDEVRWLAPARAGDTLSAESEVIGARELRSRPGEGALRMQNAVSNQDGVMVMTAITNWFVRSREAAGAQD